MPIERKFIALKDLKMLDEGSGVIEGYRSIYGVIDEGGDIVIKGAFAETLSEYLLSGFTAQSHDWDFDKAVGFPVEAHEDDHGWYVKSQFHSTPDAQNVRIKAKERMDAGKTVGFSFGYAPKSFLHIEAKDYEAELPKYVKADALTATLEKAQKFNRIRILKSVEAIEDSIVTAPMNKRAMATAVKDDNSNLEFKVWEETENEFRYRVRDPADFQQDSFRTITIQKSPKVNAVVGRLKGETATTIQSLRFPSDAWSMGDAKKWVGEHSDSLKSIVIIEETKLEVIAASESFESFDKAALAALKKFIENMQRNHEARVKEGRVLSTSNRLTVQQCRDTATALIADLDALLAMSEPKPKEKQIDVMALRTQAQRVRNRLMQNLHA